MGYEIEDSDWPLVRVRWRGTVTDGELTRSLDLLDEMLARGERFALLLDSRGAGGFSPEQRAQVIAHMKAHAELTSRLLIQATVIDNLLQRTLFYAVNLVFPNPFESKTFADPDAAEHWLHQRLAESGRR